MTDALNAGISCLVHICIITLSKGWTESEVSVER